VPSAEQLQCCYVEDTVYLEIGEKNKQKTTKKALRFGKNA